VFYIDTSENLTRPDTTRHDPTFSIKRIYSIFFNRKSWVASGRVGSCWIFTSFGPFHPKKVGSRWKNLGRVEKSWFISDFQFPSL